MNNSRNKLQNSQIARLNVRKELDKYLKNWFWFIIWISLCVLLGFFYLKYATPIYSAKASIIIKDVSEKGPGNSVYADINLLSNMGSGNIENEIGVLRSRRLMKDVVKALNLHVQYFKESNVGTVEIYENVPFNLQILKLDEGNLRSFGSLSLEIFQEKEHFKVVDLATGKVHSTLSGTPINLGFANLVISNNSLPESTELSTSTIVKFVDAEKVASYYRNRISITQSKPSSGLIELELKDPSKEKARDILDQLVLEFNRNAIEDKNLIAGNTAKFINDRLAIINNELDSVETGKATFKETNRLTDIQAQSNMFIQNANEYNKRRQEVGTQLELSNAMLEYIASDSKMDLLPSNLGIEESGVNQQISEYNALVLERNRILNGSSEKNPVVVRYNSQISQIKDNVIESLKRMRSNLQIGQEDLNRQASSIGSQIFAVPSKERQFRGIERQQNIKETLYLFLLQKREENSLSLAVTEPKAKIVDRAHSSENAISPLSRNVYLGSIVLGLFLPFTAIYLNGLLDNKIRRREDVEELAGEIGILGVIPKITRKNELIKENDRSILAESFRILITNLNYLLVNKRNQEEGVVIFVTSTVKGEGKTFTSTNLAITLSNTGKKVLLLGADLRNPKIQKYVNLEESKFGVSDYLVNKELYPGDLIHKSILNLELDIITSGTIPPNPYELLKQEKVGELFSYIKSRYDYIIVDTAPSMLVADTFLITQYADLVLYMVRAGYTEKDLLKFPLDAKEDQKFMNVSFILNDVKFEHLGYGNKYGYGYGEDKTGFWSRQRTPVKRTKHNGHRADKKVAGISSSNL